MSRVVGFEISAEDGGFLLRRLHAMRAEHVGSYARSDCWQDRVIASLERGFGVVSGPPDVGVERLWVCPRCCAVNAIGTYFCRGEDCERPRSLRDDALISDGVRG